MNIFVAPRLLIKSASQPRNTIALAGGTVQIRELCPNETIGLGRAAAPAARWYLAELGVGATTPSAADIWDMAHHAAQQHNAYVEPDIGVQWDYQNRVTTAPGAAPGDLCQYNDQSGDFPKGQGFAWHLKLSQLKAARDQVAAKPTKVRIGILDTGFDLNHQARPQNLLLNLQRNFVGDGRPIDDASDPYDRGLFKNPGHGTGTIGLLAGQLLRNMARPEQNGDYLGGAPLAEILPVRIATGVVLLYSSAFASGVDYLIAPNGNRADRVDVLSMSMGGLASKAWADVVNRAYDAGIVMVTAAGNNFPLTPQSIVYPARFRRVVAACGVMADGKPYIRDNVPFGKMAGNYGPDSKMDTALSAYTPNTSWAEINCESIVDMDGSGTSSATPQVAAAAALWLQKHKPEMNGWSPQEIVEATRKALFDSADSHSPDSHKYFGRGILQAANALAVVPQRGLPATPPDTARFSFWKVLIGQGVAAAGLPESQQEMLGVEVAQLFHIDPNVAKSMDDPDVAQKPTQAFFDAVIGSPYASKALKAALKDHFVTAAVPGADLGKPPGPERPNNQVLPIPKPKYRHLRAYATDPSLSLQLATADSNEIIVPVIWEPLKSGPVGEYLEVIDHDPATGCYYAPVDLEDIGTVANDGLDANPGDPRFHQQMVYAVAMRTVKNFEVALGRKALWSPMMDPGSSKDDHYIQRLRIYPHAFRDQNAYYNPEKKALLFGYFPVQGARPGELYPDGMAFTCLSHDIVAHETTHALLDGMHRNLTAEASVDDLAFHEAFADIVALFQHFSLPDVLKTEIGRTRGDLTLADRLAEIGQEFGRAIGLHRALRSAIGKTPDPSLIENTTEPHDRGSLLVAAVFAAFISIYMRRTGDLFRIATAGTGILSPGAIHPDLVNRLADEARKTAQQVLTMCIRALDFYPPVDLNFGDYLRAIITADYEVAPEDELGYRVAFVESFRNWGIYPSSMQTLSPESLRWRGLQFPESQAILGDVLQGSRQFADGSRYLSFNTSFDRIRKDMPLRERLFRFARQWRAVLHDELKKRIKSASADERAKIGADLGLDFSTGHEPFELHALRVAEKISPDNEVKCHLILQVLQHRNEAAGGEVFRFAGGSTLVIKERSMQVKYSILKSIGSKTRLANAKAAFAASQGLRQIYFAGTPFTGAGERFAILHKSGDEV
jgi:subtilisin family serine protease